MVGVTLATANNLNILGAIVVVALVGIVVNLTYLAVVQRMGRRSG
jgi:cell division protein FtsI/penicillin-binding protein 2